MIFTNPARSPRPWVGEEPTRSTGAERFGTV